MFKTKPPFVPDEILSRLKAEFIACPVLSKPKDRKFIPKDWYEQAGDNEND
tara:strand:- start:1116 stop:1268 length:153 start_codon:yes stop_codon:yes gene_type:complete